MAFGVLSALPGDAKRPGPGFGVVGRGNPNRRRRVPIKTPARRRPTAFRGFWERGNPPPLLSRAGRTPRRLRFLRPKRCGSPSKRRRACIPPSGNPARSGCGLSPFAWFACSPRSACLPHWPQPSRLPPARNPNRCGWPINVCGRSETPSRRRRPPPSRRLRGGSCSPAWRVISNSPWIDSLPLRTGQSITVTCSLSLGGGGRVRGRKIRQLLIGRS